MAYDTLSPEELRRRALASAKLQMPTDSPVDIPRGMDRLGRVPGLVADAGRAYGNYAIDSATNLVAAPAGMLQRGAERLANEYATRDGSNTRLAVPPAAAAAPVQAAATPVSMNTTSAVPVNGTPGQNVPIAGAPAALTAPAAAGVSPITKSVDAAGRVTFSGTGTPATGQPSLSAPPSPQLNTVPSSAFTSPPPARFSELNSTGGVIGAPERTGGHYNTGLSGNVQWVPDSSPQDKLRAMAENLAINPSRANRRSFAALQAVEQGQSQDRQFGTASKLARDQFGQSSLESNARIETGRKADERAGFDTQVKQRKEEALRAIASGTLTPEQETGQRILAGLSDKYKSVMAPYGEPDPITGKQPTKLVMVEEGTGKTVDGLTGDILNPGTGKLKQPGAPMEKKPPAGDHKGKIISGPDGRFKSDGKQWVKVA